jgi:hypothetical protein
MCDNFEGHPTIDAERAKLWPLIRATPWLDWQLLTKRADRIADNLPPDWGKGWPNVWLGVSIENNDYVGRADHLRKIPAAVRFVSYEPALGPLDRLNLKGIDWHPSKRLFLPKFSLFGIGFATPVTEAKIIWSRNRPPSSGRPIEKENGFPVPM